jgi:endonuclease YncB( thermonuclease family)
VNGGNTGNMEEKLAKFKLGDCEKFRIAGTFNAKVVKVYDGDTITVVLSIDRGASFFEHSVRMYGYDSPEIKPLKSKNYEGSRFANREAEISAAKLAKEYLSEKILNKIVKLEILPTDDKYGRLLGKVYVGGDSANDDMIKNNHGYAYYGGTKDQ